MTDGRACAARALRLARPNEGVAEPLAASDWPHVFEIARRERLVPLAWARSHEIIAGAPPPVLDAWRAEARAAAARAARGSAELGALLGAVGRAGASPIVLKGLPLSVRLYGAAELRPTADTDLFVANGERAAAHDALAAAGWTHLYGDAPDEGIYVSERGGGRRAFLEVHSSLADDPLLAHVRPPDPEWTSTEVDGTSVRALAGDFLAPYLATHLAKHADPPLLWYVDFHTLWSALDGSEREAARSAARRARAGRYLAWAETLAAALPNAARGDGAALTVLGVQPDGRVRTGHNARRLALLAATPADAARVALAWAWPNAQGRGAELTMRRARLAVDRLRRTGRHDAAPTATSESAPGADGATAGEMLLSEVSAAMRGGRPAWIRADGGSMHPAIPSGSRVRLVPPPRGGPSRGAVVLAVLGDGRPVIHRVVARWRGRVVLQGDAMAWNDPPVATSHVIAAVDAVQIGADVLPIVRRASPSLWRALRRAPRQLGALAGLVGRHATPT